MPQEIYAFAGAYGNDSFDFTGQGSHFVVASIIVRQDRLKEAEEIVGKVRKEHFPDGLRAERITGHPKRRLRLLEDLVWADFSVDAVVVDKQRLEEEGFRYRKSLYKFLDHLVYKALFQTFPKLTVMVDEEEEPDGFLRQFRKYVRKQHVPDLFGGADFSCHPGDSVLLQLAHLIAGTIGWCYEERAWARERTQCLELLRPKVTSLRHFPDTTRPVRVEEPYLNGTYHETVARMGIQSARRFIDTKTVRDQDDIDQLNCAKLLLLYFSTYGLQSYLTAKEIIRHLNAGRPEPIELHHFRTKIIAPLRDAGVLVVSSAYGEKKGYKLPSSIEDLHKFVHHGNSMILPMLSRIRIFRDQIRQASGNEIDILDRPEFAGLQQLLAG